MNGTLIIDSSKSAEVVTNTIKGKIMINSRRVLVICVSLKCVHCVEITNLTHIKTALLKRKNMKQTYCDTPLPVSSFIFLLVFSLLILLLYIIYLFEYIHI